MLFEDGLSTQDLDFGRSEHVDRFGDESALDISGLLHASGRTSLGSLLNDESFDGLLADETMATMGTKTPARKVVGSVIDITSALIEEQDELSSQKQSEKRQGERRRTCSQRVAYVGDLIIVFRHKLHPRWRHHCKPRLEPLDVPQSLDLCSRRLLDLLPPLPPSYQRIISRTASPTQGLWSNWPIFRLKFGHAHQLHVHHIFYPKTILLTHDYQSSTQLPCKTAVRNQSRRPRFSRKRRPEIEIVILRAARRYPKQAIRL